MAKPSSILAFISILNLLLQPLLYATTSHIPVTLKRPQFDVILYHLPKQFGKAIKYQVSDALSSFIVQERNHIHTDTHYYPNQISTFEKNLNNWKNLAKTLEDHYYNGHFDEVLKGVRELDTKYEDIPVQIRIQHQLIHTWIRLKSYQALSYRVLSKNNLYINTINILLERAPLARLTTDLYPSDFVMEVEKIRNQNHKSTYILQIESLPQGASIYLNDMFIGTSSYQVTLPKTKSANKFYTITIHKNGYPFYTQETNGHLKNHEFIQAKLLNDTEINTVLNKLPLKVFSTFDSELSLDQVDLRESHINHSIIERYNEQVAPFSNQASNNDFWIFDYEYSDTSFKFCIFLSREHQWHCEKSLILQSALADVADRLYASYRKIHDKSSQQYQAVISEQLQQKPFQPAATHQLSVKHPTFNSKNTFPWWLVVGGAVLLGGTAALIASQGGNAPQTPNGPIQGTITLPTHLNSP